MIDFDTIKEPCPHCKTALVYQPSAVQYWCPKCKLFFSKVQLQRQRVHEVK